MTLLTDRETMVYDLLLKGMADKEIASALGLSIRTTRFHVANILRKFNVARRTEVIALAVVDRTTARRGQSALPGRKASS